MPHVFDVATSVLGNSWAWRGGVAPDPAGGDDLVAQLFRARGAEPHDFDRLRSAKLRDWLPDPSIFSDMDVASLRLARAIEVAEPVVVFGDYDVDGATSAALLIRVIRDCGGVASAYIPDRLLEGYGPSAGAMTALAAAGATLIVTVDCGTQGFAALTAARDANVEVIVVDHHQASTALPPALAIVNPRRLDETAAGAAFGHLAAVGVAFLLAVGVLRTLRARGWFGERVPPDLMILLDLVALGTVADVVPLAGLNRAFVTQGLKVMAGRRNAGLAALTAVAGIDRAPACHDLGFALGPRINAGGRVGKSDLGVRLLTTDDPDEARSLAAELDALNRDRRVIEAAVTAEAHGLTARTGNAAVAVIASGGWHPGVIGIVAGRLKDQLKRPVIVIALEDGENGLVGKGSGRSVPGVDLGGAILAAKDAGLVLAGGGHAMAAGLTVAADRIDDLTAFLDARLGGDVGRAGTSRALTVDAATGPRGVCVDLADALAAAGPYGQGWPHPRVASGPWRVAKVDIVGDNHVRAILMGGDGARLKAMAFRSGDTALGAALAGGDGRWCFVTGRVARDDWGRTPAAELHLDDLAWVGDLDARPRAA